MKTEARYTVDGVYIRDRLGRVVLPRGCNLGGASNIPPVSAKTLLNCDLSFVGRPFPEAEADEHFARLASVGFTMLRFIITWEAVEHAGPGIYDEEYLAYLRNILKKAENFGISVFIDPFQNRWSRWTGGDGAPRWTLEAVGFDLEKLVDIHADFTPQSLEADSGLMSVGTNYLRYANATMWTLFFAGNTFAPGRYIMGNPVQNWLQDHFIDAMKHTARRLKDCDAIVGFGALNEPDRGFVGTNDLSLQQLLTGTRGINLYKEGIICPWREAGIWGIEVELPVVKKPSCFVVSSEGRPYNFVTDFLKPFQIRFMEALSRKHEHYVFFVEGVPMANRPIWTIGEAFNSKGNPFNLIETCNWYDLWNEEDLSVSSRSVPEAETIRNLSRPFAMIVAGSPVSMNFDRGKRLFSFEWDAVAAEGEAGRTEIFVPSIWYEEGWWVELFGGPAELEKNPEAQRLYVYVTDSARVRVVIRSLEQEG